MPRSSISIAWQRSAVALLVLAGCADDQSVTTSSPDPAQADSAVTSTADLNPSPFATVVVGDRLVTLSGDSSQLAIQLRVTDSNGQTRMADLPFDTPVVSPQLFPSHSDESVLLVGLPCPNLSVDLEDACLWNEPEFYDVELSTLESSRVGSPTELVSVGTPGLSLAFADDEHAFVVLKVLTDAQPSRFSVFEFSLGGKWRDRGFPEPETKFLEEPSPQLCSTGGTGSLFAYISGYSDPTAIEYFNSGRAQGSDNPPPAASAEAFFQESAGSEWRRVTLPPAFSDLDARGVRLACSNGLVSLVVENLSQDESTAPRVNLAAPSNGTVEWLSDSVSIEAPHLEVSSNSSVIAVSSPLSNSEPALYRLTHTPTAQVQFASLDYRVPIPGTDVITQGAPRLMPVYHPLADPSAALRIYGREPSNIEELAWNPLE